MALTLPYPSLTFVPLDVLTAEEMNEIVANYTYIANQFPVTGSNLDPSTFNSFPVSTTTSVAIGYGAQVDISRVANMVFLHGVPQYTSEPADGWVALSETIPDGYRPAFTTDVVGMTASTGVFYTIYTTGAMRIQKQGSINGRWLTINAVWATDDDWPS